MVTLSPRVRDHPRSRGVDSTGTSRARSSAGSSPLARGRRRHRPRPDCPKGIIPARAGSTSRQYCSRSPNQDHPRSRGVDDGNKRFYGQGPGSSPLARGRHGASPTPVDTVGIIPARAGSTAYRLVSQPVRPDHPRSRGVDPPHLLALGLPPGSSPLARGRLGGNLVAAQPRRIIPARAGST